MGSTDGVRQGPVLSSCQVGKTLGPFSSLQKAVLLRSAPKPLPKGFTGPPLLWPQAFVWSRMRRISGPTPDRRETTESSLECLIAALVTVGPNWRRHHAKGKVLQWRLHSHFIWWAPSPDVFPPPNKVSDSTRVTGQPGTWKSAIQTLRVPARRVR